MCFADKFNFKRNVVVEKVEKDEKSAYWVKVLEFICEFGVIYEENNELGH